MKQVSQSEQFEVTHNQYGATSRQKIHILTRNSAKNDFGFY